MTFSKHFVNNCVYDKYLSKVNQSNWNTVLLQPTSWLTRTKSVITLFAKSIIISYWCHKEFEMIGYKLLVTRRILLHLVSRYKTIFVLLKKYVLKNPLAIF